MSYSHLATGSFYSPLASLAFISLFLPKESVDSLWTHPRKYCLFKLLGISMHGLWEILIACNLGKKKGKQWNILEWKCGELTKQQLLLCRIVPATVSKTTFCIFPKTKWCVRFWRKIQYHATCLKLLEWSSQINGLLATWVMVAKPLEQYYDSKSHFSRP